MILPVPESSVSEETWGKYFLLRGMRDYPMSLKKHWSPVLGPVWPQPNGVLLCSVDSLPTMAAADYLTHAQFTAKVDSWFPRGNTLRLADEITRRDVGRELRSLYLQRRMSA